MEQSYNFETALEGTTLEDLTPLCSTSNQQILLYTNTDFMVKF